MLALGELTEIKNRWRWRSPDLTATVCAEAQGDGTLTVMLREDPSDDLDVRRFFSREGVQSAEQTPRLVVTIGSDCGELLADHWQVVDIGTGIKPAFDFGPDDRVHVMGMTEALDGVVWHAVADNPLGPWSPQTISTGYFYGPGDLLVDGQGTTHMAWHNHDHEDPNHAIISASGEAEIIRIETKDKNKNIVNNHDGWDNSLALDSAGQIHQASVAPFVFGAEDGLQYGAFDGEMWTYGNVPASGPFMYGLATSIAIDNQGQPRIVYCPANDFTDPADLVYAVRTEKGWDISSVVSGGIRGRFPSLALDHWGRPHVAWLDIDGKDHSRGFVRYAVLNSEMWEVEDVDTLEAVDLSAAGARKSVSLVLDGSWQPRVAYGDEQVIKYAAKPFGEWQVTDVLRRDRNLYQGLVVLRLDSLERPAIVFWQPDPPDAGLVRLVATSRTDAQDFHRGDPNNSGRSDIADPVFLFNYLFLDGPAARCMESGDVDNDGEIALPDGVHLLKYLFLKGPPPVAPGPPAAACGPDPDPPGSPENLGCQVYENC